MLDIAIVGVGAMGCLFAGHLAPYARVSMLGHWPQQIRTLQQGLTLITMTGQRRRVQINALNEARAMPRASIALVLVKSYQTEGAARALREFLKDEGLAITLQNGLGNKEILAGQIGAESVLSGTTTEGATLETVGLVRHAGAGITILERVDGPRLEILLVFLHLLQEAGFRAQLSNDIDTLIWEKVAVNAAINPLTALLAVPNGFLVAHQQARAVMRRLAQEVAAVAQAAGYDVGAEAAYRRAEEVAFSTRENRSSMLQDVMNGRPTELQAITGAVVARGRASNVPTPVNEAVLQLLTAKLEGENWQTRLNRLTPELQRMFAKLG